jgi:hypothetical protein
MGEAAERWRAVRDQIDAECLRLSRQPESVTLVVVTKFHPVSLIEELWDAGARDFGESRHQDAVVKAEALEGKDLEVTAKKQEDFRLGDFEDFGGVGLGELFLFDYKALHVELGL